MIKKFCLVLLSLAVIALTGCNSVAVVSDTTLSTGTTASTTTELTEDSTVSAEVSIIDGQFVVNGSPVWFNGVNTPWDNWNDFGNSFDEAFWDEHFKALSEAGCNASRIWINCNGMSIVRLKSTGEVLSVSEQHWTDLDKLFAIAEKYQIYLMPTLLSFDHFKEPNSGYKEWRALVQDEAATQSYIDSYIIPFVKRYGENDYCFSVDLCNEPDWVHENAESGKISMDVLAAFFAKCAAAVHQNSDLLVTVGLGMVKYNSDAYEGNYYSDERLKKTGGEDAYLDFWSGHWYYWEKSSFGYPYTQSPESYKMDTSKPSVIGELSALGDKDMSLADQYKSAYDNGWMGMFAWTSNGIDSNGGLAECTPALESMKAYIPDKIYPLGGK